MFEHLCKEKNGAVWRTVWMPKVTIPWATEMVEKTSKVSNFLPKDNPFTVLLDNKNKFFQVDNVGLIAVLHMEGYQLLHVHVTFWDGRLRGREGLCRALSIFVENMTEKFLFTQIPAEYRALIAFAKRVGYVAQHDVGSSRTMVFTNYTE